MIPGNTPGDLEYGEAYESLASLVHSILQGTRHLDQSDITDILEDILKSVKRLQP